MKIRYTNKHCRQEMVVMIPLKWEVVIIMIDCYIPTEIIKLKHECLDDPDSPLINYRWKISFRTKINQPLSLGDV